MLRTWPAIAALLLVAGTARADLRSGPEGADRSDAAAAASGGDAGAVSGTEALSTATVELPAPARRPHGDDVAMIEVEPEPAAARAAEVVAASETPEAAGVAPSDAAAGHDGAPRDAVSGHDGTRPYDRAATALPAAVDGVDRGVATALDGAARPGDAGDAWVAEREGREPEGRTTATDRDVPAPGASRRFGLLDQGLSFRNEGVGLDLRLGSLELTVLSLDGVQRLGTLEDPQAEALQSAAPAAVFDRTEIPLGRFLLALPAIPF